MFEIIKLLFDICLFKQGPEDLPPSVWLMRLLAVLNVIINILLVSLHADWLSSLLQSLVSVVLILGFSWLMLYVSRKSARFVQTAAAMLGTDLLITFFALPGMATMAIGSGSVLAFVITILLMIWHWAVTGHIFRRALEQSWSLSLGLAFLYILGSYKLMALMFPEVSGVE
jgi:predicted neutral ceramidase superfamily lipid hydrolase